jgi:hypothetical protein
VLDYILRDETKRVFLLYLYVWAAGDLGDCDPNIEHLCWGSGANPIPEMRLPEQLLGRELIVGGGRNNGGNNDTDEERSLRTSSSKGSLSRVSAAMAKAALKTQKSNDTADDEDEYQEPLALLVVHAAMHMLFLPQFTCDYYEEIDTTANNKGEQEKTLSRDEVKAQRQQEVLDANDTRDMRAEAGLMNTKNVENGVPLVPRPTSIVWAAGCGVRPEELGYEANTRKYDKNRVEILRLLLASCCDPLFSPADEYNPLASRWLAVAVAADAPNAICLFYSLLNTILTYDPSVKVPFSGNDDSNIRLVELSAQLLCVLLDCGLSGVPEPVRNDKGEPIVEFDEASKGGFNIFRTLLARIDNARELRFCFKGFVRLLSNVYESKNTYLPSHNKIGCYQELLVLLWKMLEENPLFTNHILTQCDVNELVVPICYLMYMSRRDPSQIGLVHICTFILLKLSGERSFGVALNKPFNTRLPCDLPLFSGSHSDLVAITLHKLIVNGAYKLVPLYSCFITIVCNISPYWRSMSLVAAVKLVNLFELFSSPKFLYSGENAHRHLALLLEVFNNVIQYQYSGNQHLVYAIIRRKDSFGRLGALTLHKAIAQCNKAYGEQQTVQFDANAQAEAGRAFAVTKMGEDGRPVSSRGGGRGADDFGEGESTDVDHGNDSLSRGGKTNNSDTSGTDDTNASDRFQPSEDWLRELKATLPLETITRLLQHLVPVVDELCARKNGVVDEVEILEVLKDVTMVGLLPVPHAIVIRKYQPNQYTALWFTAFMWGVIFLRNQKPPIFDGQAIELFQVSVANDDED